MATGITQELGSLVNGPVTISGRVGVDFAESTEQRALRAAEAAIAAIDAAIQTHGGNGLSAEYGLMPYWGLTRLTRIAPVNREMILNFVAQHSLGLPRSY